MKNRFEVNERDLLRELQTGRVVVEPVSHVCGYDCPCERNQNCEPDDCDQGHSGKPGCTCDACHNVWVLTGGLVCSLVWGAVLGWMLK